jgi:hypothetical protein
MTSRITGYGVGSAKVELAPVPQKNNGVPTSTTAYDFGQLVFNSQTQTWYIYSGGSSYITIGGGSAEVSTLSGNSGTATPSGGNIQVAGTGSLTSTGSGSAITMSLTGLTNHAVLVGAGSETITKVGPSASVGLPLVSQGSSADPSFAALTVSGGGTGATTLTAHGVLVGEGTSAITALAVGATGTVLAGATGANPAFTANPTVTSLVASGNLSGASVTATGDGGGTASTIQLSNVNSTTISTGTGTVHMSTANNAANTAWLKLYIGTTAYWIPAWTTNAP